MSRVSFWVGSGSARRLVGFRRVVGLALAGGCFSWWLRPSVRSFSGCVVFVFFACRASAVAFGLRASALVGFAVVVRPAWSDVCGFCWAVSVPVVR